MISFFKTFPFTFRRNRGKNSIAKAIFTAVLIRSFLASATNQVGARAIKIFNHLNLWFISKKGLYYTPTRQGFMWIIQHMIK